MQTLQNLDLPKRAGIHGRWRSLRDKIMSSLKKSEFNIKFEREGGLVDLKFGEIKARDYPDFCGAVILSAVWRKSLTPLTGAELDQLNTQFYARWYSWPSVEFKGAKL